jgi:GT2 family glycosyltransferase
MSISPLSFSIVVPTYRRLDLLFKCLQCLSHYFEPGVQEQMGASIEVIVTDDAQDPDLQALLHLRHPWCIYTSGPSRGPAANRNHGARIASHEWLVFTDDDCLPQPGWIVAFARFAHQCDVMEGRTSAVGLRTRIDEECPINETGGYLWSCNFAIKRTIFLAMGGFNELFPAPAMEDVDLRVRIGKQGLEPRFVPAALVYHPWRHRKGIQFIKSHALSVACFVKLHPENAHRFSSLMQIKNALRSFKHNIGYAIVHRQFRGLLRQNFLDCYSCFMAWRSVRNVR